MELRVLNYFLAIAREENFTRAAQQLHVTQPTLSRQIAQLEEELGVELFVRSNHNILLTEDGMILKRRAQEILSLADKTKRDFLHKDENLEGVISIGSGEFQSTRYLTDCIAAFREKHPLVRYEFYSGNAGNIRDYIERGLLDIGLMSEPVDIRKYEFISMHDERRMGRAGENRLASGAKGTHRSAGFGAHSPDFHAGGIYGEQHRQMVWGIRRECRRYCQRQSSVQRSDAGRKQPRRGHRNPPELQL